MTRMIFGVVALMLAHSAAAGLPFLPGPPADGKGFAVHMVNNTPHHMEVEKVWQQCVVTDKTSRKCDSVAPGATCVLNVVNECSDKRTEIRYRAFINNKNMSNYRSKCSNTKETADCYAVTIKARNPTGGDGKATTSVTRPSKHYKTRTLYDTENWVVEVRISD